MIFIFASLKQISRCIVWLQEEIAKLLLVLHLRLSIKRDECDYKFLQVREIESWSSTSQLDYKKKLPLVI